MSNFEKVQPEETKEYEAYAAKEELESLEFELNAEWDEHWQEFDEELESANAELDEHDMQVSLAEFEAELDFWLEEFDNE